MSFLKKNTSAITADALDQMLSTLIQPLMPQVGSTGLGADINYTAPGVVTTQAFAIDSFRSFPFLVTRTGVINRIGFVVTAGGTAGSVARCGLYACEPPFWVPSVRLVDGGEFDTTTTGFKRTAVNVPVESGQIIGPAYIAGVAAPTINAMGVRTDAGGLLGVQSGAAVVVNHSTNTAFPYAALPAIHPGGPTTATVAPAVLIRYA